MPADGRQDAEHPDHPPAAGHPDPPRDALHPDQPRAAAPPDRPPTDTTHPDPSQDPVHPDPPSDAAPRERLRVLLVEFAEPDPAAVVLARVLRDEGMEVVHAGPLDTLEQLRSIADQEDPDAVCVLGEGPPPGLADALNGVLLLPAAAAGDPGTAVKWLRGGRSHTADAPSDRAR